MKYILLVLSLLIPSVANAGGFNGSGTYVRFFNWANDAANGINITATRFDTEDSGFASGLSTTVTKDGQQTTTARIPFAVGLSFNQGTNLLPGLSVIGDTTTGLYQDTTGNLAFTSGGSNKLTLGSSGVTLAGGSTIVFTGSTSGTSTLKVPVAAGTSTIFQLPPSNGTNGQVLTSNGSGVTSWTTVASGTITPAGGGTGIDTSASTGVPSITSGTWSVATRLAASKGGTGVDLSAATGIIQDASGTISASAALASGTTATTQTANDGTTKVATDKFANPGCSLANPGYCQLPSGLYIEWGHQTGLSLSPGNTLSVTYPQALSSATYSVQATMDTGTPDDGANALQAGSLSTTGFTLKYFDAGGTVLNSFSWVAIGL